MPDAEGFDVHALLGRAAAGDQEAAALEIEAARGVFTRLGAAPELARLAAAASPAPRGPLTARELRVLRLVSRGCTNRQIAAELGVSGRTVDRHVANILTKLDVPSRAAATACAYDRKLL